MNHTDYMQRALDLAVLGIGNVSPNPMVGAVVVYNQQIIGEGYHQQFGGAHAEVHAINQVKALDLLPQSTVYVTLEPCSHYGKTPPCAHMLVNSGVKHVVIGMVDPNPVVAGNGIAYLQNHGVKVECGTLQKECEELNKRFITFHTKQRPYVMLKWAQTTDGFIAPDYTAYSSEEFQQRKTISGELAHRYVHQIRSQEDAILVGTNTVITDNPQLNTRLWKGKNPIRLVLDLNSRLPLHAQVFDGKQRTVVFSYPSSANLDKPNVEHAIINPEQELLPQLMTHCYRLQIQSIVVEGGARLLQTFMDNQCWDEAHVFTAPHHMHQGVKSPVFQQQAASAIMLGPDQLSIYYAS